MDWHQIDSILRYLNSLEFLANSRSQGLSANIENFGVFSLEEGSSPARVDELDVIRPSTAQACQSDCGSDFIIDSESVFLGSEPSNAFFELEAACKLSDHHGQQLPLNFPPQPDSTASAISVLPEIISSLPSSFGNAVHGQSLDSEGVFPHDSDPMNKRLDFATITKSPDNMIVPFQERFLMWHYKERVVNLFCVIDNAKSPWKTIHLPRVLQCSGELSFGGPTTRIRDALRNSLLSISAFYLSNEGRDHKRNDEAANWGTIASRYRCDAIGLLKCAVETDLYADEKIKYKEFLATMLSMVTINASHLLPSCEGDISALANLLLSGYVRGHQYVRRSSGRCREAYQLYECSKIQFFSKSSVPPSHISLFARDI